MGYYLLFRIENFIFAFQATEITRITKFPEKFMHMPQETKHFIGVYQEGDITAPLIEMRKLLKLPSFISFRDTDIIFNMIKEHNYGFIVDDVLKVVNIREELKNVKTVKDKLKGISQKYFRGYFFYNKNEVFVFNAEKLI